MRRARVAVLISGRGSNMTALVEAARAPDCPYEIALVLSNKPDAEGLQLAAEAGVATLAIDHRPFGADREAHERALDAALREAGVEYVALAGYMRVLTPFLVEAWAGRMINIHPSLLPKYPGLDTHRRAIEAGDAEAGCSVHLVTAGVDEGHVLAQASVDVRPDDTPEGLAERVLELEHHLYPQALAHFVRGKLDYLYNSHFFDWLPGYAPPAETLSELGAPSTQRGDEGRGGLVPLIETASNTPIRDLTCAQVRILASQKVGLPWLAEPICLFVKRYPLAEVEFYNGDLTLTVLKSIGDYIELVPQLAAELAQANYDWMRTEFSFDPENLLPDALSAVEAARAATRPH